MAVILGLGTYPIAKPLHGGQRRVAAIREFYRSLGHDYEFAAVYDPRHYHGDAVTSNDTGYTVTDHEPFDGIPLIEDLLTALHVCDDARVFGHMSRLVERLRPAFVQLEHPFLLPLALRIRNSGSVPRFGIINSTHNVEAPLKSQLLRRAGLPSRRRDEVEQRIAEIEIGATKAADLTICVSQSDADQFQRWSRTKPVVAPNGVDRPPTRRMSESVARKAFGDKRFLFVVGSAYPPNIEGVHDLIMRDGLHYLPPHYCLAVCGTMSDGVYQVHPYLRFQEANDHRAFFFPKVSDEELWDLKLSCHAVLLPVKSGGGSNLKTAEAISLGKSIVATDMSLRGFDDYRRCSGITVANDTVTFQRSAHEALQRDPLRIDAEERRLRDGVYWDQCLAKSGLAERLDRLTRAHANV